MIRRRLIITIVLRRSGMAMNRLLAVVACALALRIGAASADEPAAKTLVMLSTSDTCATG